MHGTEKIGGHTSVGWNHEAKNEWEDRHSTKKMKKTLEKKEKWRKGKERGVLHFRLLDARLMQFTTYCTSNPTNLQSWHFFPSKIHHKLGILYKELLNIALIPFIDIKKNSSVPGCWSISLFTFTMIYWDDIFLALCITHTVASLCFCSKTK